MKLVHNIKKDADEVFEYLTDMEQYVLVNPVVQRVEALGGGEYTIFERLKFGPFARNFSYWASVKGDAKGKSVAMKAVVMKMINIDMLFELEPNGDHTSISETLDLRTVLPVKKLMQGIFKKQHTQLFRNIEAA